MANRPRQLNVASGIRVETVTSVLEFEQLEGSWDALVRAMPRPSPFLLHGWLLEWWREFGGESDLAVHVAYRGDDLIGALPLSVRRRAGLRVVEFVGGSWALLADVLAGPDEDPAVVSLLAAHASSSAYDFANLFGLPGSSRLVDVLPAGSLRLVERLESPVLDLTPGWKTLYSTRMSSRARGTRRRRMRQLQGLGTVEASLARTHEELEQALEEAFRVYALRWHGRHDPSGFVTPTGTRFHRAALLRLADLDVPRLLTIRLDGQAIAFALALQLSRRTYGLTKAFDPAYARFSPGSEAKLLSLEAAAGEGVERVEYLGAATNHERSLFDRFEPIYQGIGLAQTLRGRTAVEALAGGIGVRRAIKRSATARTLYRRFRDRGVARI